jgi:hypothetical protein
MDETEMTESEKKAELARLWERCVTLVSRSEEDAEAWPKPDKAMMPQKREILAVVEYLWETQLAALLVDRVYLPTGVAEGVGIPLELTFDLGGAFGPMDVHYHALVAAKSILHARGRAGDIPDATPAEHLGLAVVLHVRSSRIRAAGYRCFPFFNNELTRHYSLFYQGGDVGFALAGVIKNIPMASPAQLTWDQVKQFRSDKESTDAYRNFHLWLNDFHPKSEGEAIDVIGQKLDDYRAAIRKHGLKTRQETFKLIASIPSRFGAAAPAATTGAAIGYGLHGPQGAFFGAGIGAALAAGLSIGGDVGVSINQEQISRSDLISGPNREIAYLHGLTEKLPK